MTPPSGISRRQAITTIASLKFRLGYRHATRRERIITMMIVTGGCLGAIVGLRIVRDVASQPEPSTALMVATATLAVGWVVSTIVFSGGEGTLDPLRLTPFPIRERDLLSGLLAAAFMSAPAAITLVATLSSIRYAPTLPAALVVASAAIMITVTCILCGRVAISLISQLLRGRRSQELAGGMVALLGLSAGVGATVLGEHRGLFTSETLSQIRSVMAFTPIGWGPEALARGIEARPIDALPYLAAGTATIALLAQIWMRLTSRILTSQESAHVAEVGDSLVPSSLNRVTRSPVMAVWMRAVRQLRRDPRELLEVAGFVPMMAILALPGADAIQSGRGEVVLSSASLGMAIGITSLNMFGADGRSFGVDALASPDLKVVLIGKALSRFTLGVPMIAMMATLLAILTNGWSYLLPSVLIGLTGLLAMTSVGLFVSTRFPFALPQKATLGGQGADGCATGAIRIVALITAMLVALPGIAPTAIVTVSAGGGWGSAIGVGSVAYGAVLFAISARLNAKWANWHIPTMFGHLVANH